MTRTTLALPAELLADADRAIERGIFRSRNELVAQAVTHELERLERAAVDAQFASMAEDSAYQEEARQIVREFATSDHETLSRLGRPRTAKDRRK